MYHYISSFYNSCYHAYGSAYRAIAEPVSAVAEAFSDLVTSTLQYLYALVRLVVSITKFGYAALTVPWRIFCWAYYQFVDVPQRLTSWGGFCRDKFFYLLALPVILWTGLRMKILHLVWSLIPVPIQNLLCRLWNGSGKKSSACHQVLLLPSWAPVPYTAPSHPHNKCCCSECREDCVPILVAKRQHIPCSVFDDENAFWYPVVHRHSSYKLSLQAATLSMVL